MNTIIVDDDLLSVKLVEQFVAKTGFLRLLSTFDDPEAALSFISSNKTHLILLDIDLPGMTGIEFLEALQPDPPQIILVTSHNEFAVDAFSYHVVDYLLKPLTYARFLKAVSLAREREDRRQQNREDADIVFVKKDNALVRIRKSEIILAEALGDYSAIYTAKEKFVLHTTLKAIEDKLPPQSYLRVHRSFIVRLDHIEKVEDDVIFCFNREIPIGKSHKDDVYSRLKMF